MNSKTAYQFPVDIIEYHHGGIRNRVGVFYSEEDIIDHFWNFWAPRNCVDDIHEKYDYADNPNQSKLESVLEWWGDDLQELRIIENSDSPTSANINEYFAQLENEPGDNMAIIKDCGINYPDDFRIVNIDDRIFYWVEVDENDNIVNYERLIGGETIIPKIRK